VSRVRWIANQERSVSSRIDADLRGYVPGSVGTGSGFGALAVSDDYHIFAGARGQIWTPFTGRGRIIAKGVVSRCPFRVLIGYGVDAMKMNARIFEPY
jgi:hypothetical protein